ncbi:uncharacterized protein JCM6883_001930 [Sporobolomyces salmoneus]|uniref:uncharacterized protein n=1 Tax=Sporobolomyces salmoneus TaxID=183962 RepID=UPI00317C1330
MIFSRDSSSSLGELNLPSTPTPFLILMANYIELDNSAQLEEVTKAHDVSETKLSEKFISFSKPGELTTSLIPSISYAVKMYT